MHYILHLVLEGFFARRCDPDRRNPIAIVRDGLVLDVNLASRKRGMSVGMETRTARAVAHDAEFIEWEEDLYEDDQRQWLDLCTDFTGIIEPEDQNSVFLDLSGHPNPVDVSEKLVRTLVKETGLHVRYGAAPSKWIAKLSSREGDCGLAARDAAAFLCGLTVSKLTPISLEHRERLNFLGYRTIGQILDIPAEVLRQQFGPEGMLIAKAAKGDLFQPVRAVYPQDSLIETFIFEGAIESLETLDLALKELAWRVSDRLAKMNMQGQELSVSVELENEDIKRQKRKFSKPIYNKPGALSSLRLIIADLLEPDNSKIPNPKSAIAAVRLCLSNLQQNKEKQKELLGHGRTKDQSAFNHVRTVFGDKSVQLGSEIAVPRRVRVLREWKNATGWS
ncbi:MAG: polymerase [Fimbriimonadaceae bacterium]|nr:polymerase [Fimbriimonadaceae bacterium]